MCGVGFFVCFLSNVFIASFYKLHSLLEMSASQSTHSILDEL